MLSPLAPLIKYWSTPKHAGRVIAGVLTDESGQTGVYYDENGKPMPGSAQVRDPAFAGRVVAETRALLATVERVVSTHYVATCTGQRGILRNRKAFASAWRPTQTRPGSRW